MKKNFKRFVAATLALLMTVTGIGAYFTSSDAKSDGYTIGQIEVEVVGDDNLYSAEKLTPNYEYEFTRSVRNIGINDAYVYMAVTLPYDEVYLHDLDGVHTANQAALTQLFTYGTNNIAGVSGEWKPVTAGKFGNYEISQVSNQLVNTSGEYGAIRVNDTVTYIYAFVGDGDTLARLAPDAETSALFDTMKFANVSDTVDQYNIEETAGQIKTQVYAIQCDNVLETTYMEGRNDDGSEAINAVWAVINNALVRTNDTPVEKVSIPVSAKDKNGVDLNASASVIEGEDKEILLDALEDQGLADKEDVDLLIDVKSDDFDDLAETTIDVSEVAGEGDKVIILHYDETKGEWEFIAEDTVDENLTVGGDFSSFSPVAIIVVPKDEYMVLFVDKNGNPLKNAEVQIMGTSISGENDHGVVGFTDDEGYLHLTKADVEKFIKAQDEDDLFGEGPRAASEAGSCDVIFAIDKFVYVAAPEELGGEKENVEGTVAFVGLSYGIYMDPEWTAEWIADQGYTVDTLPDHVTLNADGSAWKSRAPIVNTIYAEHPELKEFQGYKGTALHGGFGSSVTDIDVYGVGADGCVDYANGASYRWNKYEVVSEDATSMTIKLICDSADFSDVDLEWACGHEAPSEKAITDVKIENGALTGVVVLEKETGAPHYFFHHAALNMQVHPDYADLPIEPTPLASTLRNDLGDILPNNTSVMPYGQAMAPNADWMIMDKADPYGDMLSGNWTSYEVVAQDASTITLKLISNERDFSDVDLAYEGTVHDAAGLAEIAIVDGKLIWTHTFEKKAPSVSDKMTFTIVDTEGNPFNSSYDKLRIQERPTTAEYTFVQDAEYSNKYVGDVLPAGTYRIFTINAGTVPFTTSELVVEEGVYEYELVINPTPLYDVTLNVVDNSADAASTNEYIFIINDGNQVTVPASAMPYTLKLMGTGTHVINEVAHLTTPGTFEVNGACSVTLTLSDATVNEGVKLNIAGINGEIDTVSVFVEGMGDVQAEFDGTYYDVGKLGNGEYSITVQTTDGVKAYGTFVYSGEDVINVTLAQYAAKLVVTNAEGKTVRIRMNGGEVDPWAYTNNEGIAVVSLYEDGGFNIAEVSINDVVYNFTAELVSGNGSVSDNRVNIENGVVTVNITLELNPQVNDKNIAFHLVDGADGYYPHSSIGGIFVIPELQLAGPNGYENTFTGSDGWGETFIEAGNLPAGEYNYTLTTCAGYSTDPSMKFQSTGTFVVSDDAVQTIEIVEKFDNPVGWSGMNANKYVVADNTEVMSVTSWGEVYAILPAGTQVYVNAVLDNGFYQVDLTSIEEHIIVEELYGTTGYVAVSALSDEAPGTIEYASGTPVTLTVMNIDTLQNDDIWWDTPQTFYYLLTDNAELTSEQLSEFVGYTAHIVPNEKWYEYRDLVHALDYDEDPSIYNSYFVDSVTVAEEIYVVTGFENDESVDVTNTRVVQYNDKKHAIYHEDIGVYVTEDHTAFSETCPKCGWTCNHNVSTYTSVVDETHHNIRCYGCYSVLETVECDFTNGDCVCGNNKPGTSMTINVRFIDKYCSEFGGFDPMSTPYIPVESIKVEGDSISVANVEAAMNETYCDMGGYQIVGLVTEDDYNMVYCNGQYDWNFNFDGCVYNELTGLSNGSTIYVLLSNE